METDRFKNHTLMRQELLDAGVTIPRYCYTEAALVHLYDITFLAGHRWEFIEKSRNYRPSGTRNSNGDFPPTHSKK
jgi:hypothetical protein